MPYYLRLDGIDGESTTRGHEKWFEVASFSWGAHVAVGPGRGGGAGIGRPTLEPLRLALSDTLRVPALFQSVVTGMHIATAAFDVVGGGEQPRSVLAWTLQDVLVTALDISGDGADPLTHTALTLSYGKATLTSTGQDATGAVIPGATVGWDVGRNLTI